MSGKIPKISIQDVLGNDIDITLTEFACVSGNISLVEMVVITSLVKKLSPKMVFEIGTFDGRTSLNMSLNTNGDVYTLDLPRNVKSALPLDPGEGGYIDKENSGTRFINKCKKIHQLYGDSATFDFSPYRNQIDFMFIDGSHSYEYVIKDSWTAMNNVKPGGCILWHDYPGWPGVGKGMDELLEHPKFKDLKNIQETSLCILFK